jgi:SAM-dependent methyltransferase
LLYPKPNGKSGKKGYLESMHSTKQNRSVFRERIFRHLDGLVTAPTAYALHASGILDFILENKRVQLSALARQFNANEGYLNVALRVLCSQGWLKQYMQPDGSEIEFELNEKSAAAFALVPLYADVVDLLHFSENFHPRKFELEPFRLLEKIIRKYEKRYGLPESNDASVHDLQEQVLAHIEGVIVGPTIVQLGMSGMFHKYFMEVSFRPEEFHKNPESFAVLLDFLSSLGWFEKRNDTYMFTEAGLFYAQRASSYGVTVSYIPMFRKLNELLFGKPSRVLDSEPGQPELHVDREMNVWGSGGAHANYFKEIDRIIVDIFNRPLDEQPKGILDMGCGNGAFLKHLFEVVSLQTLRGRHLDDYPLFLVGVDFNQAALKVTRGNLVRADIWAKVIWGDIGQPEKLAKDLLADYNIELSDLLNVRTFLDHNRPWNEPKYTPENHQSAGTGAYAHRGMRLPNYLVEQSLKEHLEKWRPYIAKYGLLLIELHTLSPELTSKNIGKTPATAYDATHGFSDQYILEADVFLDVVKRVGLVPHPDYARRFPDSALGTVTINLLKEA